MTSVRSAAVRFLENEMLDGGFELLRENEKVSVRSEGDPEDIGEIMWKGEEEVVRISDLFEAIEVGNRPALAGSQLNRASPPICATPIVAASPVGMLSRSKNSVPIVFVKS
jgi:hypothetical protein